MRSVLFGLILSLFFFSCKKEDFTQLVFTVAAQKQTYTSFGGGQVTAISVKHEGSQGFYPLPQGIEGFEHEDGFEYVLSVKEYIIANPPADASNRRYVLIKILSKR